MSRVRTADGNPGLYAATPFGGWHNSTSTACYMPQPPSGVGTTRRPLRAICRNPLGGWHNSTSTAGYPPQPPRGLAQLDVHWGYPPQPPFGGWMQPSI